MTNSFVGLCHSLYESCVHDVEGDDKVRFFRRMYYLGALKPIFRVFKNSLPYPVRFHTREVMRPSSTTYIFDNMD